MIDDDDDWLDAPVARATPVVLPAVAVPPLPLGGAVPPAAPGVAVQAPLAAARAVGPVLPATADADEAFFSSLAEAPRVPQRGPPSTEPVSFPSPQPVLPPAQLFGSSAHDDDAAFFSSLASTPVRPPLSLAPPLAAAPPAPSYAEDERFFAALQAEAQADRSPRTALAALPQPFQQPASQPAAPWLPPVAAAAPPWAAASDEGFFDEIGRSPRDGDGAAAMDAALAHGGAAWGAPAASEGAFFEQPGGDGGGDGGWEPAGGGEPQARDLQSSISLSSGIGPAPDPSLAQGGAQTLPPWAEAAAAEPPAAAEPALPEGWVSGYSPEGYMYYFNTLTGESSWELPVAARPADPSAEAAAAAEAAAQAQAAAAAEAAAQAQAAAAAEAAAAQWQAQAVTAQAQVPWQPQVQPWQPPPAQAAESAWPPAAAAAAPAPGWGSAPPAAAAWPQPGEPWAAAASAHAVPPPASVDPARAPHGRPPCAALCLGPDGLLVSALPGEAGRVRLRPLAPLLRASAGAGAAYLQELEAAAARPGGGGGGGLAGLGLGARAPSLLELARLAEERGRAEPPASSAALLWAVLRLMCAHKGELGTQGAAPQLLALLAAGEAAVPPPPPQPPGPEAAAAALAEAERLLLSGARVEALSCLAAGGLWGPALLLSRACGERAAAEAAAGCLRACAPGGALHTALCLAAGLPGLAGGEGAARDAYLTGWRRSLAALLAARAAGDGAAMVALGDALWAERGDVQAAHACYLLAGCAPAPLGAQGGRLVLVGADAARSPRTFARPACLLASELLEAALRGANPQAGLPCLAPYRLAHAAQLAELGRGRDALAWLEAAQRGLRAGPAAGLNALLLLATAQALEERLRPQAGARGAAGAAVGAASKKLLGGLSSLLDRGMSSLFGAEESEQGAPPPHPQQQPQPQPQQPQQPQPQQQPPPAPALRRSPSDVSQADSSRAASPTAGGAEAEGGGMVRSISSIFAFRQRRNEARLGESNKFVFDERLKMWVEEGKPPPAAAEPPAPPPTAFAPPPTAAGAPPVDASARALGGVRSRYVDTFAQSGYAQGGAAQMMPGLAPPLAAARPALFVPGAPVQQLAPAAGPSAVATVSALVDSMHDVHF